jgi:mannose-6-phosphate isomerase-like protein (cupin superfamily)
MTAPDHQYAIHHAAMFGSLEVIDVQPLIDTVEDAWYNRTLLELGGTLVRLGVMCGEFHWHKHDVQDEFFFVLDGRFVIELDGHDDVTLGPRQGFCVPAGMRHRPVAPIRSAVLMLEKAGIRPTGD